jgi:hypothetical protein
MTEEQRFEIGDYAFTISIQSKSAHAHSLMTDYKDQFRLHLQGFISGLRLHPLPALIKEHREDKKL